MPQGLMAVFFNCLMLGSGFLLITGITSVIFALFLEFPFTRLLQYSFLNKLSHDKLLMNWHLQVLENYHQGEMPGQYNASFSELKSQNGDIDITSQGKDD